MGNKTWNAELNHRCTQMVADQGDGDSAGSELSVIRSAFAVAHRFSVVSYPFHVPYSVLRSPLRSEFNAEEGGGRIAQLCERITKRTTGNGMWNGQRGTQNGERRCSVSNVMR